MLLIILIQIAFVNYTIFTEGCSKTGSDQKDLGIIQKLDSATKAPELRQEWISCYKDIKLWLYIINQQPLF